MSDDVPCEALISVIREDFKDLYGNEWGLNPDDLDKNELLEVHHGLVKERMIRRRADRKSASE